MIANVSMIPLPHYQEEDHMRRSDLDEGCKALHQQLEQNRERSG